ncbi:Glycosyltransferase family 92 protein [Aphelenchoides fujianensis]|nr:Glycosyltransferase family 92 protein [Aphelenchoides fujianensis]KAI6229811.1 Glycosyltransferase family 92 protein [Aphelenchoides fujianensis]KAI6233106.1 Glycosyltransferase family 92 protein [Aphelenchoides fujianensis]
MQAESLRLGWIRLKRRFVVPRSLSCFFSFPLVVLIQLILLYVLCSEVARFFEFERLGAGGNLFLSAAFRFRDYAQKNPQNDHTVRITALAQRHAAIPPLSCRSERGEVVRAAGFFVRGPGQCRWWNFYLDCPFTLAASEVTIFGQDGEESGNLSVCSLAGDPRIVTYFQLTVTPPVDRFYPLVVCYSRMFYYENWQILLASLEVYRHHGASLFSVPIVSVIAELHELLRMYERQGLARIRHGVIMPRMDGLEYDPNSEVEFFNQIISNSECLYEYRDAADFVLFADVDDILVPRHTPDLVNEVLFHLRLQPLGAAFEFLWSRGSAVQLNRDPTNFSIARMLGHVFVNDTLPAVGKSIVLSKRMNAGVMHHSTRPEEIVRGFRWVRLTEADMLAVHFRVQQFEEEKEWTFPPNAYFANRSFDCVQSAFRKRLAGDSQAEKAFRNLPLQRHYYDSMAACYEEEKRRVRERDLSNCPNPLHCRPSATGGPPCVVLEVDYAAIRPSGSFAIHAPTARRLVHKQNCLFGQ